MTQPALIQSPVGRRARLLPLVVAGAVGLGAAPALADTAADCGTSGPVELTYWS